MRRSTTSVVTEAPVASEASDATARSRAADRRRLGAVLGAELICAIFVLGGPLAAPSGPAIAAPVTVTQPEVPARTVALADGRTAQLVDLSAGAGSALLDRVAAELPGAVDAVTDFWGPRWRPDISIVAAGSPEQFATLAGGGPDVAATTTAERIMFSPRAGEMNDADLRTVLRHELFHYAARADTAADAPVWLTEGVADFVGRTADGTVPPSPTSLPTDAELATPGPDRSAAYDRAWEFVSHIAGTYGADSLRALYLAACGHGHTDVATAIRTVLGTEPAEVLAGYR